MLGLKIALLATFPLAVAGCAVAAPQPSIPQMAAEKAVPKPPAVLTSAQIQIVQRGVKDGLKDPASAMFRSGFGAAGNPGGPYTVCGWVNAKNSFGGYTGYGPFIGSLGGSKFTLVEVSVADTKAEIILALCAAEGVTIR